MIPPYFSDKQRDIMERNPEFIQRGTICPVCEGSNVYHYKGEDHECPDDDYGHPMLRLAKLYWMSFIPTQYQSLPWDEFPHEDAKAEIDGYIRAFNRMRFGGIGFTIYGRGLGVGKTWAATHILRELVKLGYDGHFEQFISVPGYYKLDNKDEREFRINRVVNAEILVLDEVKTALSSAQRDFFEEHFEGLIRTRTNMNFPTIVTSNMDDGEFASEYPRVYSLLSAKNQPIELRGQDARKSGKVLDNFYDLAFKGEVRPIT